MGEIPLSLPANEGPEVELTELSTLRGWRLLLRKANNTTNGVSDGTPWARAANFVKKPPFIVNVTYSKLNGFNASMWVS